MKLKRLACGVLSAVMSFSLLAGPGGFVIPARADDGTPDDDPAIQTGAAYDESELDELDKYYETMRKNWREYLLGGNGDDLDLTNPVILSYVNDLNTEANGYWNTLIKSYEGTYNNAVFPDLDMTPAAATNTSAAAQVQSGNIGTTLRHLVVMATAWSTKGCDLYHSDLVLGEIISATDYVVTNHFAKGKYTYATSYGNWYHWDITCPTALGNIAMILYDQLSPEKVQLYADTVKYYAPTCNDPGPNSRCSTAMTGANLLLKANGTTQAGILLKDKSLLENVQEHVKKTVSVYNAPAALFSTGSDGDGFYADGSYIQHQALPYIAGYGADLYDNFSVYGRLLKDTPWEIKYDEGESPLIFDFVFDGIEPFITGTRTMDMVAGRDIVRSNRNDWVRTASILKALLGMRGTFPTDEQNKRFDEMMKFFLSQDLDYYYANINSITAIKDALDLMNDGSIKPRSDYLLTKTFAMDRTVHHTEGFTLGIAMQSTRTFGYEIINNQGRQSWNIANGMVFLYDGDTKQYGNGYWCSIDPTRLPGITAEHTLLTNKLDSSGNGGLNANIYDWTGGSSLGNNGVAGMHMKAISRNDTLERYKVGPRTGAEMKKSWFMFGDRILALGSSITSTTNDHVETTVENRKIRLNGSNVVTVDGSAAGLSTDSAAPTVLDNPSWIHLEGNVAGADIGYYFPENITLNAMKDTRTGDWADHGTNTGTATNTYATFYVDHGVKPTDAAYAYVLLPGRSAAQTAAYAADPDIEILQNDGNIHAARDKSQNILAANFWTAGAVDKIAVDAPASVIMQENEDGTITIGVSDPTKKASSITVTLAMPGEVISKDSTVTIEESKGFLKFTVDTTERLGATHTLTFQADESGEVELMGAVSAFGPITVNFGTPFYKFYDLVEMPEKAEFLANDGETYELELNWSRGDYDATAIGEFTIQGWPVLPKGLNNSAEVYVQMKVKTAGQREVLAIANTYINDEGTGSYAGYGDRNFFNSQNLQVKNDNPGYHRKTILQFDLASIPAGASHTLVMTAGVDTSFLGGRVFLTCDEIDLKTVTWNSLEDSDVKWTEAATFTRTDETFTVLSATNATTFEGVWSIDVTEAIEDALRENASKVTLLIEATGDRNGGKNQMTIRGLASTSAAQKPAIISESSGNRPANDKENLRFLLEETKALNGTRFLNYDAEALAEAVTAGQTVYDDAAATQSQVNDAEDALMRILLGLRLKTEQPEGS